MRQQRHRPDIVIQPERAAGIQANSKALAIETEVRRDLRGVHRPGLAGQQDRPDLTEPERDGIMEDLRREIMAVWGTEDVRPRKPTPHISQQKTSIGKTAFSFIAVKNSVRSVNHVG